MTVRKFLLCLGCALLVALPAFAQGIPTGTLSGLVTANNGQAQPGVTVTVSSPALQGTRNAVTGNNGGYNIPLLPPGDYKLTFDRDPATDFARLIPTTEPTTLHVMDGNLAGKGIRFGDGKRNNDCTIDWRGANSGVDWPVRVAGSGRFKVSANYATTTKEAGGSFALRLGGKEVVARVQPTERGTAFTTVELGELELSACKAMLTIRPAEIDGGDLMRLRTITLTPQAAVRR